MDRYAKAFSRLFFLWWDMARYAQWTRNPAERERAERLAAAYAERAARVFSHLRAA